MIRKILLYGCAFGAVGSVVAWVLLAYPGEPASIWRSENQRLDVARAPGWGSMISLGFGAERRFRDEEYVSWEYRLVLDVNPDRSAVSFVSLAEGQRRVKRRRIGLGDYGWTSGNSGGRGLPRCVFWEIDVPNWFVPVVLAAYPGFAFVRGPVRRWRRRKRGLCLTCGYNLEGNVSGVCPECGDAV